MAECLDHVLVEESLHTDLEGLTIRVMLTDACQYVISTERQQVLVHAKECFRVVRFLVRFSVQNVLHIANEADKGRLWTLQLALSDHNILHLTVNDSILVLHLSCTKAIREHLHEVVLIFPPIVIIVYEELVPSAPLVIFDYVSCERTDHFGIDLQRLHDCICDPAHATDPMDSSHDLKANFTTDLKAGHLASISQICSGLDHSGEQFGDESEEFITVGIRLKSVGLVLLKHLVVHVGEAEKTLCQGRSTLQIEHERNLCLELASNLTDLDPGGLERLGFLRGNDKLQVLLLRAHIEEHIG